MKWTPSPNTALDLTINPDFSQVESDVAQISVNQRFALFYPEKRPFFMEGVDLFQTPIEAVYTRTITSPRWGLRATGKVDSTSYTVLTTQDRGGGLAIIPGPEYSTYAPQDFGSFVTIARVRQDAGRSFWGFLVTDRENQGGSFNRVFGPDFQWRPNDVDQVTGQFLYSMTRTPTYPDVHPEWDGTAPGGRRPVPHLRPQRQDVALERPVQGRERELPRGLGLRAAGGLPRRSGPRLLQLLSEQFLHAARTGHHRRPQTGPFGPIPVSGVFRGHQRVGQAQPLQRALLPPEHGTLVAGQLLTADTLYFSANLSPSAVFSGFSIWGNVGQAIDFDGVRLGHGGDVSVSATVRPTDHLALAFSGERSWLNLPQGNLFTADTLYLKATYNFSARSFLRVIGQWLETRRNPALYAFTVPEKDGGLTGSILFAYKLNWQSVLYVGYGDDRVITPRNGIQPAQREFFLKISYAFQ